MFVSWKYRSVPSSIGEEAEFESCLSENEAIQVEKPQKNSRRTSSRLLLAPWIASTVLFAIIAVYFGFRNVKHLTSTSSPGPFGTDFKAAQAWVEYEERVFTGPLRYNLETGHFYRDIEAEQLHYFGEPSPEIESAWDGLLRNEFAPMSTDEAAPFTPELKMYRDKYRFEFSVLHSLHCLNAARKRLDEYYYYSTSPLEQTRFNVSNDPNSWEKIHMDHCLDQLRQAIQCQGDLSPVPLYSWPGSALAVGIGHTHTCRKWEPIREWVDRRNLGMSTEKGEVV